MSDQPQPFSPDDPRLTAYLLGELDAKELAAFEAELQHHPEAQQHLTGLRETSALLKGVFEQEPAPALSSAQRQTILSAAAEVQPPTSQENARMNKPHRRGTWAIVAALAALSVVVAVVVKTPKASHQTQPLIAQSDEAIAEAAKLEAEAKYSNEKLVQKESLIVLEELAKKNAKFSQDGAQQANQVAVRTMPRQSQSESVRALTDLMRGQKDALRESEKSYARNGQAPPMNAPARPASPVVSNPHPVASTPAPHPVTSATPHPGSSVSGGVAPGTESRGLGAKPAPGIPEGKVSELALRRKQLQGVDGLKADFADDEAPAAGNEAYEPIFENDFIRPRGEQALSTFSIDVDTASYSNVRRFLKHGQRPPADAVRIEELVNYFPYTYAPPINGDPFSVHTAVTICPWKPEHRLVRFGLKGREISKEQRPLSNLVFLVDVSGSMSSHNKLPLVKKALTMLTNEMNENDRIALVTYAGSAGVKLPSTSGEHKSEILSAINNLNAGGSTNGEAGIHLAYTQAIANFIEDGSNRVILCTDGDFNVGVSGDDELVNIIQDKAKKSGVFLSIFGFGMGNYKDAKLEKLADKGNGHYAYIDNEREAKKVFVEELTGTLYTIAKDVKIQVEFNPAHVGAYRLIGYENRMLAAQDFNDDAKDAGEIGAGHTVTALYEIIPADKMPAVAEDIDRLKYQPAADAKEANEKPSPEMLTLKLRFKKPDEDVSVKREYPVQDPGKKAAEPADDTEWQAAVAAFGMVLRNSKHRGQADLRLARELALGSRGPDPTGLRREFIDLILTAEKLANGQPLQPAQLPQQANAEDAQKQASVNGKYTNLLKTLPAPQDLGLYGAFNDYGYWEGNIYGDNQDLPKAHWVYVYPNWYLWGETGKEKAADKE